MRIDEAVDNGARSSKACERLGITERTYYRWVKLNKTFDSYGDRRTFADHSNPINKITPAERAGKSEEILNHCKEVYEAAKENGLDIFFPKTEIMGECESGTIIKQERVLDFYEYCPVSEDKTIELVDSDVKYCDLIDSQWIAAAIEKYGRTMVDKLIDFLEDNFPIVVEDLHNGNIGFRENGDPIILDFSGWNE